MMNTKMNKDIKIEGFLPPAIINTISGRYACSGSNWILIEDDVTMEDVMKGWVCTAPLYVPKEPKQKTKRVTKKELTKSITKTPIKIVIPQKIIVK